MNHGIRLAHLGIAVESKNQVLRVLRLLGFLPSGEEEVPEQGVRTTFVPVGAPDASLELLEPLDQNGAVARYLAKRGTGVQHIAFEVDFGRLEVLMRELDAEVEWLYAEPKQGAHGMRINFIHPRSAGGLLIEVMERGE